MGNESTCREHRVLTDKWNVPDGMKEIAVNRGLRDVEQTHRNEGKVIARAVPFERPWCSSASDKSGGKGKRSACEGDGPNDQHEELVEAPVCLSVPLKCDPPLQSQQQQRGEG